MGLIHIELFATLDLVAQAPGGPGEDPDGFPFGGWQAPLLDEVTGKQVVAAYEGTDALLLGRRTYEIFAAHVALLEPPAAGPTGTVYLRYALADGTPGTGDMSAPDRDD